MGHKDLYIFDTKIHQESGLPAHEVDSYLHELSTSGFIEEKLPRPSEGSFRLYHLTKIGVEECGKTSRD